MSVERLLHYWSHAAALRGGDVLGYDQTVSAGGPGGTGIINSTTLGWNATSGLHGKVIEVESYGSSFGSNGYAYSQGNQQYFEYQSLFPPFPANDRIVRFREIIMAEVTQAGTPTPLSKVFWGITKNFQADTVLPEAGMIGFMGTFSGTTPNQWQAIACDEAATIRHNVGLTITPAAPHMLRMDFDSPEGEIRFYIDETLVSTYIVGSGELGGASGFVARLGYGLNPGWNSGASANTIAKIYCDHLCLNSAMLFDEVP
jgi:hypothetical protein